MMVPTQAYIVGGIALFVGASALVSSAWQRKRRTAFAEFCRSRGFNFEPQQPGGERRFRDAFDAFKKGDEEAWRNTIRGERNGVPFIAFEYVWREGSGRSRHTENRCGLIWESDDVSFPKFALAPEGLFSKIGEVFGMQDIDFPDSPEFSSSYRLSGPNEASIRALCTPEIRQFFAVTRDQHVTGGGRFLVWWFDDTLPSVAKLDEWLEQGDHVRRRFFKT